MKKRLRKKALSIPHHRLRAAAEAVAGRHHGRTGHPAARGAALLAAATDAIGDAEKAGSWLETPNRALGGQAPVEVAATPEGAERVRQVLGRVAHGIFS